MELSEEALAGFFGVVIPHLDERQRRVVCSAMAQALGRGGSARVVEATGISTATMSRAMRELRSGFEVTDRQRAPGGGKKPAEEAQPGLLEALDELVHPTTRGNPMSPLRWTLKSTRALAAELAEKGFRISQETVRHKLAMLGYSLQGTAKANEGSQHPDRDAQFGYLNDTSAGFLDAGDPVISVDTKKKELIGGYSNGGREWQPAGEPERTDVHDFPDPALGEHAKAIPYGVFDLANNEGWVSVGDTADTAEFAVESIRRWWQRHGQARFGDSRRLLITADAGGSNGYRVRAWKKTPRRTRYRDRSGDHRLPLPARYLEVEQDRAPAVLVHLDELAGPTPHRSADHHRADLEHDHHHRPRRIRRLRPQLVPQRSQDQRPRVQRTPHPPPRLARRLELHHHTHKPRDLNRVRP